MYESQGPHPTVAVEVLQPAFQKQWCAQAIRNLGWPWRCRLDLGFNFFDKDEYKDILSIDMIKQVWIGVSSTFCFAHFWVVDTEDLLVEFLDMPSYFPFLSSPGWPFAHLILCRSKVGGEDVVGTWAALIAFFFFVWMLHGSTSPLSGRSPFCQLLTGKKCRYIIGYKLLYFEWSPPWHVGWRLSGEGCHWEYDGKNGEFENIDFRFPWLSDTSEMGFGHDVPFLNYSDRLPHPSDLCQPDRVRWG